MADDFEEFQKRYKSGKAKLEAIPPPIPPISGAAGVARAAAGPLIRKGREILEGAMKEPKKPLNRGATRLESKLTKWRETGNKLRAEAAKQKNALKKDGSLASRARDAAKRERTPREKEQFGPLVKRDERVPATQGSRAVTNVGNESRSLAVREAGRRELVPYKRAQSAVAGRPTFGDKGQGSRLGTYAKRALAAGAMGGAAYGLYKGADKSKSETPKDTSNSSGGTPSSPTSADKKSKADAFRAKMQGRNPGTKKAVDKSRVSGKKNEAKKLTNFERMKMRGYEKEGVAGRSATSSRAKGQVIKERKYKFGDIFK
jgi:hypothetical protein